MEKKDILKEWKKIKAKEKKDNPYGSFVIDEGEFVEIKSGVQQLQVEELFEGKDQNGSSNNNSNISKR